VGGLKKAILEPERPFHDIVHESLFTFWISSELIDHENKCGNQGFGLTIPFSKRTAFTDVAFNSSAKYC
jgi:hypothetical protein